MSPDFKYFFWGNPGELSPHTYMLYDGIENRFLIQSYESGMLDQLTILMSSKITLNLLDMTHTNISPTESLTDNSVIENWGLTKVPFTLLSELQNLLPTIAARVKRFTDTTSVSLTQYNAPMEPYMIDLQKQIFLFARILQLMSGVGHKESPHMFHVNEMNYDPTFKHIKEVSDSAESYEHALELLCNTDIIADPMTRKHVLTILFNLGLFYE